MSVRVGDLEVLNVILCDDIRQEIGNKRSLMGVFGGDILAAEMPAQIQLSLYCDLLRSNPNKEIVLEIAFYVDTQKIVQFGMQMAPSAEKYAAIVVPKGAALFEKDGAFRVTLKYENEEVEIFQRRVVKG